MPFVKGDPRINRKGRPRKKKVVNTGDTDDHDWLEELVRDEIFTLARENKYFRAKIDLSVNFYGITDIIRLLADRRIIKEHKDESLEWTLNRDSLAQLFKKWPYASLSMEGGFWGPVETAFKIKRYSLRYLVSTNGRYYDRVNPDYEKVKKIIQDEYEIDL
jgi:hypothetical protein